MALKDIIGQESPVGILKGCITKERIPHALLFTGDEGIGKKLTAVNFAKALNCRRGAGKESLGMDSLFQETETSAPDTELLIDACDRCPSCTKINKLFNPEALISPDEGEDELKKKVYLSHPDVAMALPYKEIIRISVIRKLEELLSYKPFEGRYKIVIVDSAELMNTEAANAFLRTLEEPSAQSILILISSRPDMLLPTIRSRCQRINFSPLPVDTMSSLLQERLGHIDEKQARLLSVLSGGRIGYALNENLIKQRDEAFGTFKKMLGGLEEEGWEDKEAMEEWFEWSQLLLRDIAVYKATGQAAFLINQDRADEIKSVSQKAGLKDILKSARELYNIKRQLIFNLNKQLTFNYACLLLRTQLGQSR